MRIAFVMLAVLALTAFARADDKPVSYHKDIKPLFTATCNGCHRPEKSKGELPAYLNFGDEGLATRMGWQLSGFIEDRNGRLRASTYEEQMFCMGCHNRQRVYRNNAIAFFNGT